MNLVVFFDDSREQGRSTVQFSLAHPVLAGMISRRCAEVLRDGPVFKGRSRLLGRARGREMGWAVPEGWKVGTAVSDLIRFHTDVQLYPQWIGRAGIGDWRVISNGRFSASVNWASLRPLLKETTASVVAVQARPDLIGYHERTLLASDGSIVGFRRFYKDSVEPVPIPKTWPHHLLVRAKDVERVFEDRIMSCDFSRLVDRWRRQAVIFAAVEVAGHSYDLSTESGLWNFFVRQAAQYSETPPGWILMKGGRSFNNGNGSGSGKGRCVGKVWLGPDVQIGTDVVLVGPSILGQQVKVEDKAVVASSIVSPGVTIGSDCTVRDSLLIETGQVRVTSDPYGDPAVGSIPDGFWIWPWSAYALAPKRLADILVAAVVLILFAPILFLIILAIKLDSKGPIFFKDRREGRYGRPFHCRKFRSMKTGADQIQEKLRTVSEVDGPQFKMADDPRITRVGRFLRETYLDEIPQFLNVLAGQMSAIGPRPSPRAENTLCPYWRYARLSVRPGVTGLWQVKRTRQPMKDFQEWIYYDTEYVKHLSFWLDMKICWETLIKMLGKFVEQFERR